VSPHWFALLLLAQQPPASVQQKQVAALVGQIRRLAASEPVVFGVDTRIRTAEVLTKKYPKIAKDLLRDASAAAGGITAAAEQDEMRVRIVEGMAPLDFEEAEHLIGSIHRGGDEDYVAEAYDKLVQFVARTHGNPREMISRGLAAGGFRSGSAAKQLEKPSDAQELFAEILSAFPPSPHDEDIAYLLARTKQIIGVNRALAIEAINKALSAAKSQKLLRDIGAILGSIDPELLKRYQSENEAFASAMAAPEPPPAAEEKQELNTPDLSGLSYSEALSQARKLDDPGARADALIEIYRRDNITSQQRDTVASEALAAVSAMPLSNSKLLGLAMISRDFARNNEPANAAFAAQALSETYSKACDCGGATCVKSKEPFDCLQLVEDFAKYLDEFKISPESMNLDNISLEARLLLLKLYPLLGMKTPSLWLSDN